MKKIIILVIGLMMFCTVGFAEQSNILTREEIIQSLNGTYNVDYQVEGRYFDALKNIYGNEITIDNGKLNGWTLHTDDIVKISDTKYVVNCTYFLRNRGIFPAPEVDSKLIVELSDNNIVRVIEHKYFLSKTWPNGEWKTDMMLYRQ
jgi:hypothetical protein